MKTLLKWLAVIAVVVGIGAALTYPTMAWWRERSAPKFLTAKVSRGKIETVVNSTGTLKPVRTVSVGAFTSGPIREIFVDFNSEITKKDQIIALIDDKLQTAAVERDEAAVASQQAELKRLEILLKKAALDESRGKKLRLKNKDFISDTEMDKFEYDILTLNAQKEVAKASIRLAKANLKNSTDQLNYTKVLGPKEIDDAHPDPTQRVKGIVIDRKVDPGQTVAATFQTPELFTIALEMDQHMYVYASVDEADIGLIREAKVAHPKVTFRVDAYPNVVFEGTIKEIRLNSTTTQNVVTYPVIIDAPNVAMKLRPGMTANITFPIKTEKDALRVPMAALRFTPVAAQVHPDDRHHLETQLGGQYVSGVKHTASEKAALAKGRQVRFVWIQEGPWLRAVSVSLGLMENQYAQIVGDELTDGQVVVTGTEGTLAPR